MSKISNTIKVAIAEFRLWLMAKTAIIYEPYLSEGLDAAQEGDLTKAEKCLNALTTIFGENNLEVIKLSLIIRKKALCIK